LDYTGVVKIILASQQVAL